MPNKFGARGIHNAAREGHVGVIKSLLAKGELVDAKTTDNTTDKKTGRNKSSQRRLKDKSPTWCALVNLFTSDHY